MKAVASSGNNEWETPPEIFNHWDRIFNFGFDVAANKENSKLGLHYLGPGSIVSEDALCADWAPRNWMNPPYGRGMILPFVRKAYTEAKQGRLTVGLLPVATSTKWWQEYVAKADYVYFYPHRINFLRDGKVVKGVAFDPCIVIWGLIPRIKESDNG